MGVDRMKKPLRALIIEDSEDDTQLLIYELNHGGYDTTYERVETAAALTDAIDKQLWDIIISDHSMPSLNAPKALEILRKKGIDLPFIIVSGKMSDKMAVTVMKAGAHDYIPKNNLARVVPVIERELSEAKGRRSRRQAEQDLRKREEELSQINERLRRTLEGTVRALALAVEKRDPYTAGHQIRVTELARAIAQEMDLERDTVENIRSAGILHDIGKICVPAEILTKPGKLTKTEYMIVQSHAQVSYEILQEAQFHPTIAEAAHQHHERLNGSGYPMSLTKDKILIEAKILAVADVVEAMASHRPYRPALGFDLALEEVSNNSGILYDPQAVDACLKLINNKGFHFKHATEMTSSSYPKISS